MRLSSIRHELLVGWFILAALLISGVALIIRPRTQGLMDRHVLSFSVEHGQGLQSGSPVLVQGIQVGEIDQIVLTPDNKVEVTCHIRGQYAPNIRKDATVTVVQPPILGNTRVEIDPGVAAEPFQPGKPLPVRQEPTFLDKLSRVEVRVDGVIAQVTSFVDSAVGTLNRFGEMVDRIDRSEGITGQLVNDKQMAEDLKESMASLRRMAERIEKEAVPETVQTVKDSQALVRSLQQEDGRLQTLLADLDATVKQLQDALREAKVGETAATVRRTADTFASAATELRADTRPLTRETRQMLQALQDASRAMKKLSDELARQPDAVIWGRRPDASPGVRR
ncbi:MAG: MlaD family protein [Planctomycetota bacterium]